MILALASLMVHRTTHANTAVEFHSHEENDSITKSITKIGFSIAAAAGATLLGRWLTPIGKLEKEIQKLTADEMFVRRWMLINDTPESLEKGRKALANIEKEKKAREKKLRRTEIWAYPLIIIAGSGAMLLALSLGD